MKKIPLNIIALANSENQPGNYALILEESEGLRRLAIIIGAFEAQAIAITLERMKTNRPMTHDLFRNTLDALGCKLTEVVISDIVNESFHATLLISKGDNEVVGVDARSSDAVALAVRFACPIYTTEAILESAGFMPESSVDAVAGKKSNLQEYSIQELEQLLEQVLEKEDYESAARIRDAIEKKK